VQLGAAQAVGPSDAVFTDLVPTGAASDYVGTGTNAGQVRVRVVCQSGAAFTSSGNFMKLVYDAP
jgi:hypothetical protein